VDPDFGTALAAEPGWKTMGAAGIRAKGAGAASSEGGAFPRLEKTRALGELFKALFKDKAEVLSGSGASGKALSALPLEEYRYAVFGTHGILDADLPYVREPALVLSDGFLTMSRVMDMRLSAEAVALTACQTGMGRSVGGEGVMGMGRAFQYAGARSVLMSLWPVAEDGAVALAGEFFTALSAGAGPREALSQARARVRKEGWEHPFYWAAFILMAP
jgi:CHAT domain-containing protein